MKERLDILLVNGGFAPSREKAKAIIMSGSVFVEGQREDKAGSTFSDEVNIEIKGHVMPYVSRGGKKKEKSLDDCIETLKRETRRYAKRQLTWFNRDEEINWIYVDRFNNFDEILNYAISIAEKGL